MKQNTQLPFSGQTVYVGMDVHAHSIVVQPALSKTLLKRFTISPADPSILIRKLKDDFRGASFESVYEAGFCGFYLQRALEESGIKCIIVNPADIASTDKDKRRKTDSRDATKLVRELRNGNLNGIYVPDLQAEQDRQLIRLREELVRDERRCQQRIKAYLKLSNDLPEQWPAKWQLTKSMIQKLEVFAQSRYNGQADISLLTRLRCLKQTRQARDLVTQQIKSVMQSRHSETYKHLLTIPGVGPITASYLILELIDMDRFANEDKLSAYVGLVPDVYNSGPRQTSSGITRRANKALRRLLIEASWVAIRSDKTLAAAYGNYARLRPANKAIIKVARKLLTRIRAVWVSQSPYDINLSR